MSWRGHGEVMARSWRGHGDVMARSWRGHGSKAKKDQYVLLCAHKNLLSELDFALTEQPPCHVTLFQARAFQMLEQPPIVKRRHVDPKHYNTPRTVFLSIRGFERDWKKGNIPEDTLETALLIFDCDRSWVFPKKKDGKIVPKLPDNFFDAQYYNFDKSFLELLSFKEEAGLLHWFRPEKSYKKMSDWFCRIQDPMNKNCTAGGNSHYGPLQLEEFWWWRISQNGGWQGVPYFGERKPEPRFVREINKITSNFKTSSFEMRCTAELIVQSNPSLDVWPWDEVEEREAEDAVDSPTRKSKKKGRGRGNSEQLRKKKEKERALALQNLEGKIAQQEWEVEKGEISGAIEIQSVARGIRSREQSRERGIRVLSSREAGRRGEEEKEEEKKEGEKIELGGDLESAALGDQTKVEEFFEQFSGTQTVKS